MTHNIRTPKSIFTLLIAISMLLVLSSCSVFNSFTTSIEPDNSIVSEAELVRLLVNSINSPSSSSELYFDIPEHQRSGVSYSDYALYIEALSSMSKRVGEVSSYRFLRGEEKTAFYQQLLADSGLTSEQLRAYGDIDIIELMYDDSEDINYIFVNTDEDKRAYLSADWIKQTNRLYSYINLYYNEISKKNIEGFESSIEVGYSDEISSHRVISSRAERIIDYYFVNVRDVLKAYDLVSISPVCAKVSFPDFLVKDNDVSVDRLVVFTQRDEVIKNNDIVPVETDITQFILFRPTVSSPLLRIGNNYTSNSVVNQIGRPMHKTYSDEVLDTRVNSNGEIEEKHKIIYNYHGLRLIFEGYFTDVDNWVWDGELCAIKITDECDFVLGNGIRYGMSEEELLTIYPFLELYDYHISYSSLNANYTIDFTLDSDSHVESIVAQID